MSQQTSSKRAAGFLPGEVICQVAELHPTPYLPYPGQENEGFGWMLRLPTRAGYRAKTAERALRSVTLLGLGRRTQCCDRHLTLIEVNNAGWAGGGVEQRLVRLGHRQRRHGQLGKQRVGRRLGAHHTAAAA